MMTTQRRTIARRCILFIFMVFVISITVNYTMQRRSTRQFVNQADVVRYANATWARRRISRMIHQTYRTLDVPSIWNRTVQSVVVKNAGEFDYHLWTDAEMNTFVRKHELHFYRNTYVKYPFNIQRVDAFRYILMFYLGGVYIDMDNGCNRPFKELLATLESLDPSASHLAMFSASEASEVDIDFMISTPGHPIHKQFIARLSLFNHHFLFPFWTVFFSTGPIYAAIQEHFFAASEKEVVRILNRNFYRPYFVWKENGGTWFGRDATVLIRIGHSGHFIVQCCLSFFIILAILLVLLRYRRKLLFF